MVLIKTNSQACERSPNVPLDLTLEGYVQGHIEFAGLYLAKELS